MADSIFRMRFPIPRKKFVSPFSTGPLLEIWPRAGATSALFYPGTMIEPAHYEVFLFALYLCGFNVCALHLSGHGRNIRKDPETFTHLLEEGLRAGDWLVSSGMGPVVVCGHSQGGIYALAHAAASSTVSAAFAIDALFPSQPCAMDVTRFGKFHKYRSCILAILAILAKTFPKMPVPLPFYLSGHRILAGKRNPVWTGRGKSRIAYPMRFLYSLFTANIKPEVECPFLLFAAINDELFTPDIIRQTFSSIISSRKELVWLPDGGHLAIFNPWLASLTAKKCACTALSIGLPLEIDWRCATI